jgi:hypothetical protein
MSSRKVSLPQFPVAPATYDPMYMAEVVRSFSVFLQQMQNPGDMRGTTLTLTNLPSHNQGLETGALFEHGGYVIITQANLPYPDGASGTGEVGSVSVTIG